MRRDEKVRFTRLLAIVGPAAVLYVLAARAASSTSASPEWLVAVSSLALSLTPLAVGGTRKPGTAGVAVAWMGVSLAVAIASARTASPVLERVHETAWLLASVLMLDLVLRRWLRGPARYAVLSGLVAAAIAGGILARDGLLRAPAFWVVIVSAIMLAGVLHQVRLVARGHTLEGAVVGTALVGVAVGLAYAWFGPVPENLAATTELAAAALLWLGHLAWADPRWRSLRRVGVPAVGASAVCFAVVFAAVPDAPLPRWQLGLVALAAGVLWWLTFSAMRRLSTHAIWSTSGRLSDAAARAREGLVGGASLEDIVLGVLAPFDEALGGDGARSELFSLQPPLRARLAVGPRVDIRTGDPPETIVRALFGDDPRQIVDFVPLSEQVVRQPAVRALVEAMGDRGVGCVLPCVHQEHVEGLLCLPLAGRSEALSALELDDLRRLGDALGGTLASALAQRRADTHVHELSALRRQAEERISVLEGEVAHLRDQCDVLGRSLAEDQTLHVAYSASMRRVQTRAIELAPLHDPVLIVAPAGSPVLSVSRFIHERGPRWEAPFIVADCSAVGPDEAMELLFGSAGEGRVGWLHSATGGTLLLRDLPALSLPAQSRLAEVLSDGSNAGADVRVIATSRAPRPELQRRRALEAELAARLSGPSLTIPSLRQRREDVPSLVLLAIDRACRVLAREPLGIAQEAMAALIDHDWPGDVAELELVVELAANQASGKTIELGDLPPLAWPSADERESLDGTYLEVERRLLQRALLRSGNNKSEAARMLGLKRTTFLDKLRRHGLDQGAPRDVSGSAVG